MIASAKLKCCSQRRKQHTRFELSMPLKFVPAKWTVRYSETKSISQTLQNASVLFFCCFSRRQMLLAWPMHLGRHPKIWDPPRRTNLKTEKRKATSRPGDQQSTGTWGKRKKRTQLTRQSLCTKPPTPGDKRTIGPADRPTTPVLSSSESTEPCGIEPRSALFQKLVRRIIER